MKFPYKKKLSFLSSIIILILLMLLYSGTTVFGINGESKISGIPLKERYTSSTKDIEHYYEFLKYPYYSAILEEYEKKEYKGPETDPVVLRAKDVKVESDKKAKLENNIAGNKDMVFLWDGDFNWTEWEFEVALKGLYCIEIEYYMLEGSGNPAVRSMKVNGEIPFIEANYIVFDRIWKDVGEPVINSLGDEVRPGQVEEPKWRKVKMTDGSGFYSDPFTIYLEEGKNSIRFEFIDQSMAISSVALIPAEKIFPYKNIKEEYEKEGYKEAKELIFFEAECNAIEKSSPTIRRETNSEPIVTPASYKSRKLNVIGGWRWRIGNHSITWEFQIPEDGLYKIGMHVLQVWNDGLPSYRQIAIDGKVPFKELKEYSFQYNKSWKFETLKSNEDEPYLFYFTKGVHTITMTVKMGPFTPILQSLNTDTLLLSKLIRDIIKITGSDPDPNYDYEFFDTIPTLKEGMENLNNSLQEKYDSIKGITKKVPAMANNFLTIKKQLQEMIKNPFSIASRMNELNSAQSSLGTWYLNLQNQPLLLDSFKIGNPNERWGDSKASLFQKIKFSTVNFLLSFKKDYTKVGSVLKDDTKIHGAINVWIARGMEWAEIIKEMADEDFTPNKGIMVNINVLPSGQLQAGSVNALMLAIASGRAPDVALGVDSGSPVEFAMRDAAYDLSKFEDFNEVSKRFLPGIFIPYRYLNGVYAVPETMDFNVMFYRKDIIEELGIRLPDTREDLYNFVLPALYQNSLQFFYPRDFTQFIFQHGGDYYTPDGRKSGLDTPEAFRAFQEFIELFTDYGIPISANFYNRMRTGEMPIGIGNFGLYMQLSVAAPELAGRWGIAPLPGLKMSDGSVDRTCGALAGQCNIILTQSKNKNESWEFIKWWSSTKVQTQFARELEALIGTEARWNTANVEAFCNLSWKIEDLKVIQEQWKWAKEVPVVLGGYFTGRYITNAWNAVVLSGGNIRDELENAVKEINRELRMKQEEYGVFESQR